MKLNIGKVILCLFFLFIFTFFLFLLSGFLASASYARSILSIMEYKNVMDFFTEYKDSKAEYGYYRKAVAEWEKMTGEKVDDSFKAKLQQKHT